MWKLVKETVHKKSDKLHVSVLRTFIKKLIKVPCFTQPSSISNPNTYGGPHVLGYKTVCLLDWNSY